MKYISTRGQSPALSFHDVATSAIAPDGGLYLPESWPHFELSDIQSWYHLSYQEVAFKVMKPFIDGYIDDETLKKLIKKSYGSFRDEHITPLRKLREGHHILELFHGPTLAFKDVALQFLGNVMDYFLQKDDRKVVILGATSGDTGSAAIEGCLHSQNIRLFMLHPHNRVSDVQRKQMTTICQPHIYNLAVGAPEHGNFDDCQDMVKAMFGDPKFFDGYELSAVNSINWVRILAQVVYYFYASLKLNGAKKAVSFSVPTGNFGDIFAGYIAKKMGLPIHKLIVATNSNDILNRYFKANDYSKQGVSPTVSPSMDIQISSNFERLLFDLHNHDGKTINTLMDTFKTTGKLQTSHEVHEKACSIFVSESCSDEQIKTLIHDIYHSDSYVLDPHTATGLHAAFAHHDGTHDIITLATAHPAKFPDVIKESIGISPALPSHLIDLMEREEHVVQLPNDIDAVKQYIATQLKLNR